MWPPLTEHGGAKLLRKISMALLSEDIFFIFKKQESIYFYPVNVLARILIVIQYYINFALGFLVFYEI